MNTRSAETATNRTLLSSGVLLGAGLGGFFDGILLHQILQWHNMLSSRIPPVDLVTMKVNMLWDGLFHAFTWLMTLAGAVLLFRAGHTARAPHAPRLFVGALLLGWGAFNFVEGIIDHQLFGLHHVHPGENQLAWDIGFIALGLVQLLVGWALVHNRAAASREVPSRGSRVQT